MIKFQLRQLAGRLVPQQRQDRHDEAWQLRKFFGHGAAQVGGERGDVAFARQIIHEKGDLGDVKDSRHECY